MRSWVLLGLVLLTAVARLWAQGEGAPPRLDAAQFTKQIDGLLTEKRFEEAVALCENSLKADPQATALVLPQLARMYQTAKQAHG